MFGWLKTIAPLRSDRRFGLGSRPPVSAVVLSDAGLVRANNEDAGCFRIPHDPALLRRRGPLCIVADGMGGHAAGEVASSLAVERIGELYYASGGPAGPSLALAFELAGAEIFERAQAEPALAGMGTTCAALAILGESAVAAYVGDTRIYLIRGEQIRLLSEDHTVVAEMVRQGLLTPAEARGHEDRNVVTRALGTRRSVEVGQWREFLRVVDGDRFVLATDGVHDLLEDTEILAAAHGRSPARAAAAIIDLTKARGGHDNATVAVVQIGGAAASAAPDTREQQCP